MNQNPLIAKLNGSPLLMPESAAGQLSAALSALMSHARRDDFFTANTSADDGYWPAADDWRSAYRPYVVCDGVLHIPVKGVLLHDFPWALGSWATGYVYIARALERGLADANVQAIALVVDSYGGQVAGCFEVADKIFAGRSIKPIRAFAHESAYSAGYAIASSAARIVVSATGGVGSIGVVTAHVDVSQVMEKFGVKVTFIFAGKHKVDGNPYEPLPDDVKVRIQMRIDETYGMFCTRVARHRGLDDAAVRATEAECFSAAEATRNGLADAIGPFDDAVSAFVTELSSPDEEGEGDMNDKTASAAQNTAALDAARTEGRAEGHAAGKAEGVKDGVTAERQRIGGILGCDESKGRESLARHLAFNTGATVDEAKATLAAAPAASAAPTNPLADAMKNVTNPDVGADADNDQSEDAQAASMAGGIVSLYRGGSKAA